MRVRSNAAIIITVTTIMEIIQLEVFSFSSALSVSISAVRTTVRRAEDGTCAAARLWHRQQSIFTAIAMASVPEEFSLQRKIAKRRKKGRGKAVGGDRLRESTGIRPSIHPTVINCISEILLLRSQNVLDRNGDDSKVNIDIGDSNAKPLDIAITAGDIASSAIKKRKDAAKSGYEGFYYYYDNLDGDDTDDDDDYSNDEDNYTDEHAYEIKTDSADEAFNEQESQLICGRVVGVTMRLRELEETLIRLVMAKLWVRKYNEEGTFGVLREECDEQKEKSSLDQLLAEKIVNDPLIRMYRAECLLALFLNTVERPTMEKISSLREEVLTFGNSNVDFIDADRLEVLMNDA